MDADKVVRDFCDAWGRGDVESIMAAFTDDAVYHNIPMEPPVGKEAIRGFLDGFLGVVASSVHFEIRNQLVAGNLVMNERVDTLTMESGEVPLPVCGVFELSDDGRIKAWRDYFDMVVFSSAEAV